MLFFGEKTFNSTYAVLYDLAITGYNSPSKFDVLDFFQLFLSILSIPLAYDCTLFPEKPTDRFILFVIIIYEVDY